MFERLFKSKFRVELGLVLIAIIFIAFLYAVNINPSGGARGDLKNYHYPSYLIFKEQSFVDAMTNQESASGPLYYAFLSFFNIEKDHLRIIGSFLLLLSVFLFKKYLERNLNFTASSLIAFSLLINPFVLGPAIWGNPDILSLLFVLTALNIFDKKNNYISLWLGSVMFAMAVLTRQSSLTFGIIFAALIYANSIGGFDAIKRISVFSFFPWLSFLFLYFVWDGFTPPNFSHHFSLDLDPALQALGYLGLLSVLFFICNWRLQKSIKKPIFSLLILLISCLWFFEFIGIHNKIGVIAILSKTPVIGSGIVIFLLAFGAQYIIDLYKSDKIISSSIAIYIATFSLHGEIFFTKYLEPYLLLISLIAYSREAKDSNSLCLPLGLILFYSIMFFAALIKYH